MMSGFFDPLPPSSAFHATYQYCSSGKLGKFFNPPPPSVWTSSKYRPIEEGPPSHRTVAPPLLCFLCRVQQRILFLRNARARDRCREKEKERNNRFQSSVESGYKVETSLSIDEVKEPSNLKQHIASRFPLGQNANLYPYSTVFGRNRSKRGTCHVVLRALQTIRQY